MKKYLSFQIHMHTVASDGGSELIEMAREAKEAGLDGIILTDHNTMTHQDVVKEIEEETGLIIIMGIEYTTFFGHVVSFGGNFFRWENIFQDNLNEVIDFTHSSNGVIGIAHPMGVGDPVCTGCAYNFKNVDFSKVDYIEVLHDDKNTDREWEKNKEFYLNKIKEGHIIYHLYGCDFHNIAYFKKASFSNYIELKEENNNIEIEDLKRYIINEIKEGRILPSKDVLYNFSIKINNKEYLMGEVIESCDDNGEININFLEPFSGDVLIENENGPLITFKVENSLNISKEINLTSSKIIFIELKTKDELIYMSNGIFIR